MQSARCWISLDSFPHSLSSHIQSIGAYLKIYALKLCFKSASLPSPLRYFITPCGWSEVSTGQSTSWDPDRLYLALASPRSRMGHTACHRAAACVCFSRSQSHPHRSSRALLSPGHNPGVRNTRHMAMFTWWLNSPTPQIEPSIFCNNSTSIASRDLARGTPHW